MINLNEMGGEESSNKSEDHDDADDAVERVEDAIELFFAEPANPNN